MAYMAAGLVAAKLVHSVGNLNAFIKWTEEAREHEIDAVMEVVDVWLHDVDEEDYDGVILETGEPAPAESATAVVRKTWWPTAWSWPGWLYIGLFEWLYRSSKLIFPTPTTYHPHVSLPLPICPPPAPGLAQVVV